MARTYLLGRSPELATRTWESVIASIRKCYHERVARTKALRVRAEDGLELIQCVYRNLPELPKRTEALHALFDTHVGLPVAHLN